jgi:hypothetical protein
MRIMRGFGRRLAPKFHCSRLEKSAVRPIVRHGFAGSSRKTRCCRTFQETDAQKEAERLRTQTAAQTSFRLATIVLSRGTLLRADEMAFFDAMAARGELQVAVPVLEGLARYISEPFFTATLGKGTLSTTLQ